MTRKDFLKGTPIFSKTSNENDEIIDLIQAIENKKQELHEAELIVQFHPKIINNLEKELFKKLKEGA